MYMPFLIGVLLYLVYKLLLKSFYVINQNERAVKTIFGRADRIKNTPEETQASSEDEKERYNFPKLRVIQPGGPYFRLPWEKIHRVSVATSTLDMAYDPESPEANKNNTALDAVTKDQLNIELSGQIRYRISENNRQLNGSLFVEFAP